MLTMTRRAIVTLRTVDERRLLLVEAMQAVGLLVDEGVVLRHELPANFSGVGRLGGGLFGCGDRSNGNRVCGHYSVLVFDDGGASLG